MIIYAGIDGTGTADNEEYAQTFANSFVNRLQQTFSDAPFYSRGPTVDGMATMALASLAFVHVMSRWRDEQQDAVVLAGYSRGGAAVIETAQMLKEAGVPVEALILFDAVDRSTVVGTPISEELPPSLRHLIPAKYNFRVGQNTKIASTVKQVIYPQRLRLQTRSRLTFQNCGFLVENAAMPFLHAQFYATHGGMGGCPWTRAEVFWGEHPRTPFPTIWEDWEPTPTSLVPASDAAGSAAVWAWAFPQIVRVKIECLARLGEPDAAPTPGQPMPGMPGMPNPPGQPPIKVGERLHIVQSGDWLSKIAGRYYGDVMKWDKIYRHPWNLREIGSNPDLIKPGMRLVIPT